MPVNSNLNLNFDLAFPDAGVTFNIAVDGNGGGPSSFSLKVTESAGGGNVPITSASSPQLSDWVRGYSRWLRRARVTADHDETGISGTFDDDLTPEQVFVGLREACDMIRQRFEAYESSVLV